MDGVDINLEDDEDDSIYGAQDHRQPPHPHHHISAAAAQHHANVHPQSPANHFRQNATYGDEVYQQRNQVKFNCLCPQLYFKSLEFSSVLTDNYLSKFSNCSVGQASMKMSPVSKKAF